MVTSPLLFRLLGSRSARPGLLFLGLLFLGLLGGLGAGCGGPVPPGGHGHLQTAAGRPALLSLEGTPYEMGWWHGHLLRERILKLREQWETQLFRATVGGGPGGGGAEGAGGALGALRAHCALCEDQVHANLSEARLQELDGLAAATGLKPSQLLWMDVIRDALRMKGLDARLIGTVGLARTSAGLDARAWWTGPDAELLAGEAIVIHRKPEKGPESVALSWPGSVGAIAGILSDGRGYLLADAQIEDGRKRGFGAGRPMTIASWESLFETRSAGLFMAAAKATMGHVLLGFSVHPDAVSHPVRAMAGVVYYVDPDPPRVLEDGASFLAGVPYENPHDPRWEALRDGLAHGGEDPEQRWMQLRGHADAQGGAAGEGLRVRLRYESGHASLEAWGQGEDSLEVSLAPAR